MRFDDRNCDTLPHALDAAMIGRSGLHAIRAMVALAEQPPGTCAGAAALATSIGAPQNYLGKLLRVMARNGLVESQKGLGGGFRLSREPGSITLQEIVDPIEPLARWSGCFLGRPSCSDDAPCAMHSRWALLRDAYVDLLNRTTVAELCRHEHGDPTPGPRPSGDPR